MPLVVGVAAIGVLALVGVAVLMLVRDPAKLPEPLREALRTVAPMTDSRDSILADYEDAELELKDSVMRLVQDLSSQTANSSGDSEDAGTAKTELDLNSRIETFQREVAAVRLRFLDLLIRAAKLSPLQPDQALTSKDWIKSHPPDPFSDEERDLLRATADEMERKQAMTVSFALQSVVPFMQLVVLQVHLANVGLPDDPTLVQQLAFEQSELERKAIVCEAVAIEKLTRMAIEAEDPNTITDQPQWKAIVEATRSELAEITAELATHAERVRTAFREQPYTGELDEESLVRESLQGAMNVRLMLDRHFKMMSIGDAATEGIAEIQRKSSLVWSMYRNFKDPSEKPRETTQPSVVASKDARSSSTKSSAASQPSGPSPGTERSVAKSQVADSETKSDSGLQQAGGRPGFSGRMGQRGPEFMRRGPGASGPRFGPGGSRDPSLRNPSAMGGSRPPGLSRPSGDPSSQWLVQLKNIDDIRQLSRPEWTTATIVMRSESGDLDLGKLLPEDADVDRNASGFRRWLSTETRSRFVGQNNATTHVLHLESVEDLAALVDRLQNVRVVNLYAEEGYAELAVDP